MSSIEDLAISDNWFCGRCPDRDLKPAERINQLSLWLLKGKLEALYEERRYSNASSEKFAILEALSQKLHTCLMHCKINQKLLQLLDEKPRESAFPSMLSLA